jgi:hypothetical protein
MQRGREDVGKMVMVVLCECESGRSVCKVAKGDLGLAFCWLAGWRGAGNARLETRPIEV